MKRQAGFTGTEILLVVAVAGVVFTLLPDLNPVVLGKKLFGGGAPQQAQGLQRSTYAKEALRQTPVYLVPQGQTPSQAVPRSSGGGVIAYETTYTNDAGTDEKAQVLTYGQRVAKFFAGLSTWGLSLIIGGLLILYFVFGVTPWMISNRLKKRAQIAEKNEREEKEKYRTALKNTVAGINETPDEITVNSVCPDCKKVIPTKVPLWKDHIRPFLVEKQDKADRKLVGVINAELVDEEG